ncbi:MAG TPA: spore maturation protein [Bacillota bacterium]|nr:spore maturation protein [Bacillota bacterium]HPT87045.1 spore maturation protein [Bacillota bacterium]
MAWLIKLSHWCIPILLLAILGTGYYKKIKVYEVFIQGAIEGLQTTFKLMPYIIAIFTAIGLFRTSGALEWLLRLFRPVLLWLHLPPDLLTLGILKPLSGSAALGTTAELLSKYGPDSVLGMTASIIQGSCETTFYVISLYLGSVGIRDSRHLIAVGLISELAAFAMALWIGSLIGH